jgi:hypothetical protein
MSKEPIGNPYRWLALLRLAPADREAMEYAGIEIDMAAADSRR